MVPIASCIPFPFLTPRDAMLTMLVCATRWLSMHLHTLAYIFMHESCLLVCRLYFNTMKLCLLVRGHHLLYASLVVCLLVRLLILLLVMSPATCYACFACMLVCFILIAHYLRIYFFPLLVCWFLVFTFACTHTEWEHIELGHSLLRKQKGRGCEHVDISQAAVFSRFKGLASPI